MLRLDRSRKGMVAVVVVLLGSSTRLTVLRMVRQVLLVLRVESVVLLLLMMSVSVWVETVSVHAVCERDDRRVLETCCIRCLDNAEKEIS